MNEVWDGGVREVVSWVWENCSGIRVGFRIVVVVG